MRNPLILLLTSALLTSFLSRTTAAEIDSLTVVSNVLQVKVKQEDSMDVLRILTSSNLISWTTNVSSAVSNTTLVGPNWTNGIAADSSNLFVRAEVQPISSARRLAAHVLNRLAYGHTPYELGLILGYKTNDPGPNSWVEFGEGVADGGIGVDAWINTNLNPASLNENVTNQFTTIAPIAVRFGARDTVILTNIPSQTNPPSPGGSNFVDPGSLDFDDFRAWFTMHAIGAQRQLQEVLLHWCENHFVSAWGVARNTFQGRYNNVPGQTSIQDRIPTQMESTEHMRYRTALVNPNITFLELLRIQHESESMTVYLDTNDSLGNSTNVANENYGREILELYTMGVDNGYDQGDITALSLAWTGWDVRKVDPANINDLYNYDSGTNPVVFGGGRRLVLPDSNSYGVFVSQFRPSVHGNSNLHIFYNRDSIGAMGNNYPNGQVVPGTAGFKTVPARFNGTGGITPNYNYANKNYGTNAGGLGRYSLFIANTATGGTAATNSGTDGIANTARTNKAYTIMSNLADLPFTQEYISVKLCRLLVHDNFTNGYNFSDGVVSPEEQLVWNCMAAWRTNTPKGQIYKVVKAITDSSLFRSEAAYRQKLKDPLEFAVSAVRALRFSSNDTFMAAGGFSATSDGYSIAGGTTSSSTSHALNRMGTFLIFNRDAPDGYPETGPTYVGASGLAERSRWINSSFTERTASENHDGLQGTTYTEFDPVGVIYKFLGTGLRDDADAVARLFLRLLFPGEGGANLDEYRREAILFLNTADNGNSSLFNSVTVGSVTYDTRVRRMVAMLMSLQRFNEQ